MANWLHARCNLTCFFCFSFPLHRWRCRWTDLAPSYCNRYWFYPSKIRPKVSSQKSANEQNLQETSEKCAKHHAIAFEVIFVPAFLWTCRHTRPLSPAPSGFARRGKTTVFTTWIWLHPGPGPSQGGSNTVRPLLEGANILNMAIWMDMDWFEIILITCQDWYEFFLLFCYFACGQFHATVDATIILVERYTIVKVSHSEMLATELSLVWGSI